jgi:hypothetical protein
VLLTLVVDHDVAGLARGLGADHALDADNLSDARILLLGDVDLGKRARQNEHASIKWCPMQKNQAVSAVLMTYRNVGLVIVRLSLEEVEILGTGEGRAGGTSGSHTVVGNDRGGDSHPQSHGGLVARAQACEKMPKQNRV